MPGGIAGAIRNAGGIQNLPSGYVPNYDGIMQNMDRNIPRTNLSQYENQVNFANAQEKLRGLSRKEADNAPHREMNFAERLAARSGKLAEDIVGASGFEGKVEDTEDLINFLKSVPLGMVSAPFSAAASGYELASGAPVTEANLKDNTLPDYELDWSQRTAAGADAFIDLFGLAGGGSAKVFGAGAKAVGKAFGKDIAKTMTEGWAASFAKNNPFAKEAISLGSSMAEEGAEEFGQSLLEDTRYKELGDDSFDKALTAAGWGAAGGAVMHGAGRLASWGIDKVGGDNSQQAGSVQTMSSTGSIPPADYSELDSLKFHDLSAPAEKALRDQFSGADRIEEASVSSKHVAGDAQMGLSEMHCGVGNLKSTYMRSDNAAKRLAETWKTDTDTLYNALFKGNYEDASGNIVTGDSAAAMELLRQEKFGANGGPRVIVGRNPDTKNGGYGVYITKIENNDWHTLNPVVYTLVNSDVDGDTSQIFFKPEVFNAIGDASRMMVNPTTGKSNLNWKEFSNFFYRPDHKVLDKMYQYIDDVFTPYNTPQTTVDYVKDELKKSWNPKTRRIDNDQFSRALDAMLRNVDSARTKMKTAKQTIPDTAKSAISAVDGFVSQFGHNSAAVASNAVTNTARDFLYQVREQAERVFSNPAYIERRGRLGKNKTAVVEHLEAMGMLTSIISNSGNPGFRQIPQAGYNEAKIAETFHDNVNDARSRLAELSKLGVKEEDAFRILIRTAFHQIRPGKDPADAIEGILDSFIIVDTFERAGLSTSKIRTSEDLDRLTTAFKESYNRYAKILENANKDLTGDGWKDALDAVNRKELTDDAPNVLAEKFGEVFSDRLLSDVFDDSLFGPSLQGLSFHRFIEANARDRLGAYQHLLEFEAGSLRKFVSDMIAGEKKRPQRISRRLETAAKTLNTHGAKAHYLIETVDPNTGEITYTIDPVGRPAFMAIAEFWGEVLSGKMVLEAHLADINTAIQTNIGRRLYIGTWSEQLSAAVGISLRTQYKSIQEALRGTDAERKLAAIDQLNELSHMSALHARIRDEMLDTKYTALGESVFYNHLIDYNEDYEAKKAWYLSEMSTEDETADLLVDALTTEEGRFAMPSVSRRVRAAETAKMKVQRLLYEKDRDAVAWLQTQFDAGLINNNDGINFIEDRIKNRPFSERMDTIAVSICDARAISHKGQEKGTIEIIAQQRLLARMLEVNGGTMSFIDEFGGYSFGTMLLDDFASNRVELLRVLSDPDYELRVVDKVSGKSVTLTRYDLLRSVNPELKRDQTPNFQHWLNLFERHPQLASYLCTYEGQPGFMNGEASVKGAVKENLKESFKRWQEENSGQDAQGPKREVKDGINYIGSQLLNEAWYTGALIHSLPEDAVLHEGPEALAKRIEAKHREWCTAFYCGSQNTARMTSAGQVLWENFDNDSYKLHRGIGFGKIYESSLNNVLKIVSDSVEQFSEFATRDFETPQDLVDAKEAFFRNAPASVLHEDLVYKLYIEEVRKRIFDAAGIDVLKDTLAGQQEPPVNGEELSGKAVSPTAEKAYRAAGFGTEETIPAPVAVQNAASKITSIMLKAMPRDIANNSWMIPERLRASVNEALEPVFDDLKNNKGWSDEQIEGLKSSLEGLGGDPEKDFKLAGDWTYGTYTIEDFEDGRYVDPNMAGDKAGKEILKWMTEESHGDPVLAAMMSPELAYEGAVSGTSDPKGNPFTLQARWRIAAKKINSNVQKDRNEGRAEMGKLLDEINARRMNALIREVNRDSTAHVETNTYKTYSDTIDAIDEFQERMAHELAQKNLLRTEPDAVLGLDTEPGHNGFPRMTWGNSAVAGVVINQRVLEEGARAPIIVGVNGQKTKDMMGFDMLSASDRSKVPPRKMTKEEILTGLKKGNITRADGETVDANAFARWHVVSEGTWAADNADYKYKTLAEFRKKIKEAPDGAEFEVFDPSVNAHGNWVTNSLSPYTGSGKRIHMLSSIFGLLCDDGQEAQALKAKKAFASLKRIVNLRVAYNAVKPGKFNAANVANIRDAYRDELFRLRRNYASWLYDEWFKKGQQMGSIGLNEDHALMLAQAMTPGIKVTLKRGDEMKEALIDASHLMAETDTGSFAARIADLTADGWTIEAAEVHFASATEVSYKIMRDVFKANNAADGDLELEESGAEADKSIGNWDDTEFNTLGIDEVLGRFEPMGKAHPGGTILSTSPTAMQILVDEETGAIGTAQKEMRDRNPYRPLDFITKEGTPSEHKAVQLATEEIKKRRGPSARKNPFPRNVARIWKRDQGDDEGFEDSGSFKRDYREGIPQPYQYSRSQDKTFYSELSGVVYYPDTPSKLDTHRVENGVGILACNKNDKAYIQSAIEWSRATGSPLYVPQELYEDIPELIPYTNEKKATIYDPLTLETPLEGYSSFYLVEPAKKEEPFAAFTNYQDSPLVYRKRGEFNIIGVDGGEFMGMANPTRINFTDAGIIFGKKAKEIFHTIANSHKMAVDTVLPHPVGQTHILSLAETKELFAKVEQTRLEDEKMWADLGLVFKTKERSSKGYDSKGYDGNKKVLFNDLWNYLDYCNNLKEGEGDSVRKVAEFNKPVAIVQDEAGRFFPVMIPQSGPTVTDWVECEIQGETLVMGYTSTDTLFNELNNWAKHSIAGEAFKGIGTLAEFLDIDMPTYQLTDHNGQTRTIELDEVINGNTEGSRVGGRELPMLLDVLWNGTRAGLMNPNRGLFRDANGEWNVADQRIKNLLSNPRFICGNWDGGWDEVYNHMGELLENNGKGNDPALVAACKRILVNCRRYGINPMIVFDINGSVNQAGVPCIYQHLAFEDIGPDELLKFFHACDSSYCPNGYADTNVNRDKCVFDKWGRMKVTIAGDTIRMVVRIEDDRWIEDMSHTSHPGSGSKVSPQHIYRRAADTGFQRGDMNFMFRYNEFMTHNPVYLRDRTDARVERMRKEHLLDNAEDRVDEMIKDLKKHPYKTYAERKNDKMVYAMEDTYTHPRKIMDGGEEVDWRTNQRLLDAEDKLKRLVGGRLTHERIANELVADANGWTYNNGAGVQEISLDRYIRTVEGIVKSMTEEKPLPIKAEAVRDGGRQGDRFCNPLLSPSLMDIFWEGSTRIRNVYGTKKQFKQAMVDELERVESAVADSKDQAQKRTMNYSFQYKRKLHGLPVPKGYIYSGMWMEDLINADGYIIEAEAGLLGLSKEEISNIKAAAAACNERLEQAREYADKLDGEVSTELKEVLGGHVTIRRQQDGKLLAGILNAATDTSKFMAMMNPELVLSNVADRGVHQKISEITLAIGRKGFGPYATKRAISQETVNTAVNQELFMKLWISNRQAGFSGEEQSWLSEAHSEQEMVQFLEEREKNMSTFQKIIGRGYDIASGGNFMIKQQMRNFINRFAQFCENDPANQFWFAPVDENGTTLLEYQLAMNPGKWFADIMGANKQWTASLKPAQQAMNWSRQGDMAQRNAIGMILSDICRRSSVGRFLMTTTVSRFPQYGLNITGRALNWILPMSTLNYRFNQILEEHGGKLQDRLHFEEAQIHRDLREAMIVDMCKLGVSAMTCMLIGASGMLEPPDDDKKRGNIDEWTVCGMRVSSAWWISDILGLALPCAAFVKSAMDGQIRVDLMINGINEVCYNNPIIRLSDAVGFFADPEGSWFSDYERDVQQFAEADGGSPSLLDWVEANSVATSLSWAAQFITPSVVREWYVNAQDYEASYRRVWAESATGALTDEGENGETEMTSYTDAMIRRATRRNPVLGFIMDAVLQPNTGYMWHEMPDTQYYDDAQLASREYWSVEGLSDDEAEAKCLEIIAQLQSYSGDLEGLERTGFSLDSQTKAMVSSMVWDIYHTYDDQWLQDDLAGLHDYYYYGDFETGREVVDQMKLARNQGKQYWNDFYYEMVRPLSTEMQSYRRYNTTYARDVNGEPYATGIHPGGVLPFESAPGTLTDPEGTAGYENDWNTISAVTGEPLLNLNRALVPNEPDYTEWPDLKEWAADGDGSSYSKFYANGTGDTSGASADTTGGNNYGGSKKPGGYYRRSGGYYRRGGGGGGGYSGGGGGGSYPNIYSHAFTPQIASPRAPQGSRIYSADFSYLRPDFETKGSREAYKRSDI